MLIIVPTPERYVPTGVVRMVSVQGAFVTVTLVFMVMTVVRQPVQQGNTMMSPLQHA